MSIEAHVISAIIQEGSPKKAFQASITDSDFAVYEEEWQWIVAQAELRQTINARRFKKKFPDFEFLPTGERLQDLLEELKQETAYIQISSAVDEFLTDLDTDNVVTRAELLRDSLADALKIHSPQNTVPLTSDWRSHIDEMRRLRILRDNGQAIGIPTGFKNLDHHWGGHLPGRLCVVLGRPGDSKSFTLAKFATSGFLDGRRVGLFSPEMNEHEHRCRVATLLSADPEIQEEFGLRKAFRNRALMEGRGFNEKTYKRFWQYLESRPGEISLFTRKFMRRKMSPSYIESKIDDLGLEMVIVDPIYKLKSPRNRTEKRYEIEDTVDAVQDLCEAYNIPIVISNQAHRQGGNKGDAPNKNQSYNSDAPVQEGDQVIGLKFFQEEHKLRMKCSKNRFGDEFAIDVKFYPNVGIMEDITPIRGDYYNGYDPSTGEKDVEEMIREAEKGKSNAPTEV